MKRFLVAPVVALVLGSFAGEVLAGAVTSSELRKRYPDAEYVVGIGEAPKEGQSGVRARRAAEVLARAEVAKVIKVHVKEETVDIMCEGKGKVLGRGVECRNMVVSVVEQNVDLVLSGVRIAETVEGEDSWLAVALLERRKVAESLAEEGAAAARKARDDASRARAGDTEARKEMVAEYRRAVVLKTESESVGKVKRASDALFDELEKEASALGVD